MGRESIRKAREQHQPRTHHPHRVGRCWRRSNVDSQGQRIVCSKEHQQFRSWRQQLNCPLKGHPLIRLSQRRIESHCDCHRSGSSRERDWSSRTDHHLIGQGRGAEGERISHIQSHWQCWWQRYCHWLNWEGVVEGHRGTREGDEVVDESEFATRNTGNSGRVAGFAEGEQISCIAEDVGTVIQGRVGWEGRIIEGIGPCSFGADIHT